MTFKTNNEIWGATSTNLEKPNAGEIASGHLKNSTANSGWVNWHNNSVDNSLEQAHEAAQASSGLYPSPLDRFIASAGAMHSNEYSTNNPSGDLCRIYRNGEQARGVCSGWNHYTNRGCVYYYRGAYPGYIYRVNTWDVGALSVDTLDLDMSYVGVVRAIASDGNYLYLGYLNTNTGTYHIAQLSLSAWTGLAVLDQDTGWASTAANDPIMLAVARPGVVGAYYNPSDIGTFGVWKTGVSWVTGAGNTSTVLGSYDASNGYPELQATYGSLYTVIRTDYSLGAYFLINCDVDAPGSVTVGPATSKFMFNSVSVVYASNMAFRAFSDRVFYVSPNSEVYALYDDGSADWTARNIGDLPISRSPLGHSMRITLDGNGKMWMQYRAASAETGSGRTPLIAVAFPPWVSHYDCTQSHLGDAITVIPIGTTDTSEVSSQWLNFDGRNLVSTEVYAPGPSTIFRSIVTPGLR